MNIVIFGAPGSGKGTQGKMLADAFGITHLSTGALIRRNIAQGTELGKLADELISHGQLIPDDLMVAVLAKQLRSNPSYIENGVILDGFPRTIAQAEELSKLFEALGVKLDAVVGLEVEEEELIRRILERAKTSGRSDDNLETVKKRLDVYHNQTSPLREYYIAKGKYMPINGNGTVDEIYSNIHSALSKI